MVLPFFHAGNGQTCRQNHPKKARILPRKTQMAIRRHNFMDILEKRVWDIRKVYELQFAHTLSIIS